MKPTRCRFCSQGLVKVPIRQLRGRKQRQVREWGPDRRPIVGRRWGCARCGRLTPAFYFRDAGGQRKEARSAVLWLAKLYWDRRISR